MFSEPPCNLKIKNVSFLIKTFKKLQVRKPLALFPQPMCNQKLVWSARWAGFADVGLFLQHQASSIKCNESTKVFKKKYYLVPRSGFRRFKTCHETSSNH